MQPLITDADARRLRSLLSTPLAVRSPMTARSLDRKLDSARIVSAHVVPPTVVTMNSRVACVNVSEGRERELTLVYPWAHDASHGRVSILSRIGVDLLAAIPGRKIWIDGVRWNVLCVAYQPEAERMFHL